MTKRSITIICLAALATSGAGPATQPAGAPAVRTGPAANLPSLFDDLRAAAAKRASDPIGPLADRMSVISSQLDGLETGQPVQERERAVTGNLDAVIKQLEAQVKGGAGGSRNPTKPAARSQITKGPGGIGPLHDAKNGTKLMMQLGAKDRQQVTQSQTEGFPPGYEKVLAGYYSRLSAEQVNGGGEAAPLPAGAAGPTTRPDGR